MTTFCELKTASGSLVWSKVASRTWSTTSWPKVALRTWSKAERLPRGQHPEAPTKWLQEYATSHHGCQHTDPSPSRHVPLVYIRVRKEHPTIPSSNRKDQRRRVPIVQEVNLCSRVGTSF